MNDPVTPDLYEAVIERDFILIRLAMRDRGWFKPNEPPCIAWVLDPSEICSGRWTLDHVKDQPRMGKRAPSDLRHLVTLCEKHHLETQAGSNWATSHRPLLRAFLTALYGEIDEGEVPQGPTP